MYNQLPMQAQLRHENMRGTRFETWAVLENIKLVHLVRRSHIRRVPVTGTQAVNVAVAVAPVPALPRRSPRVSAS